MSEQIYRRTSDVSTKALLTVVALFVWLAGSGLTHVIACLENGSWGLLITGVLFYPVAVINGTGVWFGVW